MAAATNDNPGSHSPHMCLRSVCPASSLMTKWYACACSIQDLHSESNFPVGGPHKLDEEEALHRCKFSN